MKLIKTYEIKEFKVDLYRANDDFIDIISTDPEYNKYNNWYLMVENRYLQVYYRFLKDYLQQDFLNRYDPDAIAGIKVTSKNNIVGQSLLKTDSLFGKEVIILSTKKGYKIDCLELTTQEAKELYLNINKFIRNYERTIDEK